MSRDSQALYLNAIPALALASLHVAAAAVLASRVWRERTRVRDVDLVLALSDHADFDDLVRLARESGARRVITMHGAKKFAALLRELGLDAEHLAQHPSQQKSAKGAVKRAATGAEPKLFE